MINLNELDIDTEYRKDDEEFNYVYQKFCILIIDNDNETAEKLKKEILENHKLKETIEKRFENILNMFPENQLWSKSELLDEYTSILENAKK